jgi:EAL domain-containing protein (putative c-di-GMP-specific phosphodiesterase class I)
MSVMASRILLQCREGQGYYFSRPLVAEQFARLSTTRQAGVLQ